MFVHKSYAETNTLIFSLCISTGTTTM